MAWKSLAALANSACVQAVGEPVVWRPLGLPKVTETPGGSPLLGIFHEAHNLVVTVDDGEISDLQTACDLRRDHLPRDPAREDLLEHTESGWLYRVTEVQEGPNLDEGQMVRVKLHKVAFVGAAALTVQTSTSGAGSVL